MNHLKDKFKKSMQDEIPTIGPITEYLAAMRSENPEGSATLEADIIQTFTSDEGLRVLKMLEKSILYRAIPQGGNSRALREMNAQRNLVLEIRRIVSHGR